MLNEELEDLDTAARKAADTVPQLSVIAFSGGIDSSILASILKHLGKSPKLLTMGLDKSADMLAASIPMGMARDQMVIKPFHREDVERTAIRVSKFVQVSNLSHLEDCIAFWLISEHAKGLSGVNTLVSANGPDELFCGYDRFRRILDSEGYGAIPKEITRSLIVADNLSKEVKMVGDLFGVQIVEPFLSEDFRSEGLKVPGPHKIIPSNDLVRKRVWRCLGRKLHLPEEIVMRPKKAMQYGMGIHQIVSGMLKRGTLKFEPPEI
jgi:asparagine synthase (glutamine-hydrolysing)